MREEFTEVGLKFQGVTWSLRWRTQLGSLSGQERRIYRHLVGDKIDFSGNIELFALSWSW